MSTFTGETGLTKVPKLLEGAKLAFVLALREAFKSPVADENLRYNDNQDLTKIKIWTAHPLTLEFYPAIVVSAAGGDASIRYLPDDLTREQEDGSLLVAGQLNFTISMTVLSQSTLERERLIDHLIVFVRHLFRDVIHGFGLEYTRDMRIGSENIVEVENRPVYEQTFDVPCYMEYRATVDRATLDCIRRIDVVDIMMGNTQISP